MNTIRSFLSRERNSKSVVRWNFMFYMVTFFYSILIGVVLVPLYLKHIPRDIYGYWLATGNILNLLTLIDPGFSGVIQQKISLNYGKKDFKKIGEYSYIGVIIGLIFAIVIGAFGIIGYYNFASLFPKLNEISSLNEIRTSFIFALIGSILMIIYYIFGAINYGMLSSKGVGLINVVGNFGSMISIIILLKCGYGVLALGLGALFRGIIYLSISILYTFLRFSSEKISIHWNKLILREFISLTGYNFLGKIGLSATTQVNSYITTVVLNPNATTVLKFTQTVPDFSKLFVTRLANSTTPIVPNLLGKGDYLQLNTVLSKLFYTVIYIIGLIMVGFFILNHSFIKLWVGDSFYGGDLLNALILILLLFSILSEVTSQIVFSLGNIKKNSLLFFLQGIIYLPLVIILAKKYNLNGILLAGIFSHLFTTAWYLPYNLFRIIHVKKSQINKFAEEILKIMIINVLITLGFKLLVTFDEMNWIRFLLYILIIIISYFLSIYLLSKKFRNLVKNIF